MAAQTQRIPLSFANSTLDKGGAPQLAQGPTRLTGIDGREFRSLRRFPGMKRLKKDNVGIESTDKVKMMWYASIQKGQTTEFLRGFVVLIEDHTGGTDHLEFQYYDTTSVAAWKTPETILTAATIDSDDIDVSTSGKYLFVVQAGATGKVVWFDGTNVVVDNFEPQEEDDESATPNLTASGSGGQFRAGQVIVAVRYRSSTEGWISGLRSLKTVFTSTNNSITFTQLSTTGDYDQVDVFRTVVEGGRLYLHDQGAAANGATYTINANDAVITDPSDEILQHKKVYEPNLDAIKNPPLTNRIVVSEGVAIMRKLGDDAKEPASMDLGWSHVQEYRPYAFNPSSNYRVKHDAGEVVQFVQTGGFAFALLPTGLIRFHKSGTRMDVNEAHWGFGPRSRAGAIGVGNSLFVVTERGFYLVDGASGDLNLLGNLSRLVYHDLEWAQDIDNDLNKDVPDIHVAHDEALGAVFVTNNVKKECILFWTNSGRVSMLSDWPFTTSTTGPDPETGGPRRAWFGGVKSGAAAWHQGDFVYAADLTREESKLTNFALGSVTVNGTATGGDATSLIDTGATFADTMVGAFVHVWQTIATVLTRTRVQVTARSGTDLTITPTLSQAVASGDRYSIAPIPMEWTGPPFSDGSGSQDVFKQAILEDLGFYVGAASTQDASTVNSKLRLQSFVEGGTTEDVGREIAVQEIPVADDHKAGHGSLLSGGLVVQPGFETYGSNEDLEIIAGVATVTQGDTDIDA